MKLTAKGCRERQRRLAVALQQRQLDGAIISRRSHVYYFTGFMHDRLHAAAAYLGSDGVATLVAAGEPEAAAVDGTISYAGDYYATIHSRQFEALAEALAPVHPDVGSTPSGQDVRGLGTDPAWGGERVVQCDAIGERHRASGGIARGVGVRRVGA